MLFRTAILAAGLLGAATAAHAGELTGTVRDATAQPVAGAEVAIPALGLTTTTAADGSYRFENLAAGEHRIAVTVAEDVRQHIRADVPETGEATRNVFLYAATALDHARSGVSPAEAMLGELLMTQAWDAASEMTGEAEAGEAVSLDWDQVTG